MEQKSISSKFLDEVKEDCPAAQGFRCGLNGEMCRKPGVCLMIYWFKKLNLITVPLEET